MYNTANNLEDLHFPDELLSYKTVAGLEENYQIIDKNFKNADFVIYVSDFSEIEKIKLLLQPCGFTAYVIDDEGFVEKI